MSKQWQDVEVKIKLPEPLYALVNKLAALHCQSVEEYLSGELRSLIHSIPDCDWIHWDRVKELYLEDPEEGE